MDGMQARAKMRPDRASQRSLVGPDIPAEQSPGLHADLTALQPAGRRHVTCHPTLKQCPPHTHLTRHGVKLVCSRLFVAPDSIGGHSASIAIKLCFLPRFHGNPFSLRLKIFPPEAGFPKPVQPTSVISRASTSNVTGNHPQLYTTAYFRADHNRPLA